MITHSPAEPQNSPRADAADAADASETCTAGSSAAVMDPREPIEVASAGAPPVNNPAGTDNKPPGFEDLELFV